MSITRSILYPFLYDKQIDQVEASNEANEKWRYVAVNKRSSQGVLHTKDQVENGEPKTYFHLLDIDTNQLFTSDSPSAVSVKCALLTLYAPFYTALSMAYRVAETIFNSLKEPFEISASWYQKYTERSKLSYLAIVSQKLSNIPKHIIEAPKNIGRDLAYGMAIQLIALRGVFKAPFVARRAIEYLEQNWNRLPPTHQSMYTFKKDSPCFMAFCFQPVGHLHDTVKKGYMQRFIEKERFDSIESLTERYRYNEFDCFCPGFPLENALRCAF